MTTLNTDDIKDRVLLLNINITYREGMTEEEVLDIAYRAWRVDDTRKNNVDYALAVYKDEIKGVFEILSWEKDIAEKGKWAFKGRIAEPRIRDKYMTTLENGWKQGPKSFMYVNC